jgi:hypothetical protein
MRVMKSKKSDGEKEIEMFSHLMEVAPELLHEIDLADYSQIQEAYSGFLASNPDTSEPAP